MDCGATGGKLLGAGGGGFMLFFAAQEYHASIRSKLSGFSELEFNFDREGTRITHYDN